jgi:thioesterase domain-containing protein
VISDSFDVELTKDGSVHDPAQVTALLKGCGGASDLLVLCHGWNNDLAEARRLYDAFLRSFEELEQPKNGPGSRVAVLRVYWPSKKFTDEQLVPGGGAASAHEQNDTALVDLLTALRAVPERLGQDGEAAARVTSIDRAIAVIPDLEDSAAARQEFVLRVRSVLDPDDAHPDDASEEFFTLEPEELFDRFGQEVPLQLEVGVGGVADVDEGGAAFLGDMLSGARSAARRIANFATYYQMKSRAGAVGRGGVAATLTRVRDRHPELPLHLVGHSFGGRVMVSAAAALEPGDAPVTLSLLQAAFSHNGLARDFDGERDGAFRTVLQDRRITGPVIITHTKADRAVGIAYPLASRIARDNAAALGDKDDPYGGMGRNGAQHTPEVATSEAELRPLTGDHAYAFERGKVYNLLADGVIADHGDVTGVPVANAVQHAILTT